MKKWGVLATLVMCSMARADITVDVFAVTFDPIANNFLWSYEASLSSDARLDSSTAPEDYFTIYDFGGYVTGSVMAPTGWMATVANTGQDVPGTAPGTGPYPADNPLVTNLTFTWIGGTWTAPGVLGTFEARSTFGQSANQSTYVGQSTNNTGRPNVDGDPLGNIGTVDTPLDQTDVVPEPSTMALLGSALLGLGVLRSRRR